MKLEDLQALACDDCPANVTVQRGEGVAGPVLTVVVVHEDSCPWSVAHVPPGGVVLVKESALLRHVRKSDDALGSSA